MMIAYKLNCLRDKDYELILRKGYYLDCFYERFGHDFIKSDSITALAKIAKSVTDDFYIERISIINVDDIKYSLHKVFRCGIMLTITPSSGFNTAARLSE